MTDPTAPTAPPGLADVHARALRDNAADIPVGPTAYKAAVEAARRAGGTEPDWPAIAEHLRRLLFNVQVATRDNRLANGADLGHSLEQCQVALHAARQAYGRPAVDSPCPHDDITGQRCEGCGAPVVIQRALSLADLNTGTTTGTGWIHELPVVDQDEVSAALDGTCPCGHSRPSHTFEGCHVIEPSPGPDHYAGNICDCTIPYGRATAGTEAGQ